MQANGINEILLEVRKSYRLLFEYQKRILDLVDYIGKSYNLKYDGGYSKFSDTSPRNGSGSLDSWAWDWLSMYYYEFHFKNKVINNDKNKDTIYFSLFILNDDGYFQAKKEQNIARTSVSKFVDVEKSNSKLIFVVGKNYWDSWGKNWDDLDFILKDQDVKRKSENEYMIFKSFSLECFENEDNAKKNILEFEKLCQEYNIKINIEPKIK